MRTLLGKILRQGVILGKIMIDKFKYLFQKGKNKASTKLDSLNLRWKPSESVEAVLLRYGIKCQIFFSNVHWQARS